MTDFTARPDEDETDYALRVASLVSPAVLTETSENYGDDLTDAVPLMSC